MSRIGNSVPTGKICTTGYAESCKKNNNNPEFKHWPWMMVLERPNNADPGLKALKAAGFSGYCTMCHDCFEDLWAPAGSPDD